MNERAKAITEDIVEAVRDVFRKHDVTFGEYRAGFMHLVETQKAGEIPLLIDVFFNRTIVDIENETRKGSKAVIQGPYFVPDAPHVTDALAIQPEAENEQKMVMRGQVADMDGAPVAGAVIDVWHSTPDGRYSGIERHGEIDKKYYRGKITTDDEGRYEVRSIMPVPYQIPNKGPTGKLLEDYMGKHSWRPAHIHYWIHADGKRDLISQAYFEGDKYVDDDSCSDGGGDFIVAEKYEGDERVMEVNFTLEPAQEVRHAAE